MRILGLDGGIASVGWAVIDEDEGRIIACGARCFDAPETDKERIPTNQIRRQKRGMRRVIRRRRQRMTLVRSLLAVNGLLADAGRDALRLGIDPWRVRSEGLGRILTTAELAAALGHIAAHRGFRSNSKRDRGANAADESSKMLKAIAATQGRLGQYATVGAMFATDPEYAGRKRNRGGDFSRSVMRDDLAHEVGTLFAAQRRLGNAQATPALEEAFKAAAFFQRPLQDSDALVGDCPFEPGEKRTARRSCSFELFRLVSRLNTLTLSWPGGERRLTVDEVGRLVANFGKPPKRKLTFNALRKTLDLDPGVRFDGIGTEDEGRDVVARSGIAAEGTATLRDVLGEGNWRQLLATPEVLDRMAEIITFRDDTASIRAGIAATGIDAVIVDAVLAAVEAGRFAAFKGAGHISAKAARAIIPGLLRGLVYDKACAEVGYDHAAPMTVRLDDVRNPIARKALGEMLKQVRAVIAAYGMPDRIHVELARDVGKSAEERDEISRGIEQLNKKRDRSRDRFRELLHREPGAEDMLRFELWQEQNGRCLYTDEEISPDWVVATDNRAQVDHILPWSRFGDNSFANRTLCLARANQQKRGRTPFEWFGQDKTPAEWETYMARVEGCKEMKRFKKRGFYLRKNATEVQERFRNRNLGDTRYATRALMAKLESEYGRSGVKVLARPGALTSKLRRGWGLQGLKKAADGTRLEDDRHHALDAIVLAATSERMVQQLTLGFQDAERKGLARDFAGEHVTAPWPGFRLDAEAAFAHVFVSRPERRRVPGEAHAATIKQMREVNGETVVFVRKSFDALTEKDLDLIPVPAPYGRIADPARLRAAMIGAIRAWWAAGRPKDVMPRMPNGDFIRKVRVATKDKPAVTVRGGTADRGDMARVDVFRELDARGKTRFHLVPVYPHQIATMDVPPNRAVVAYKADDGWTPVDRAGFEFRFSLYQNSLVEVTKPDGEVIGGYFKGVDRSTGAMSLADVRSQTKLTRGIGAKTLLSLRKLDVSRLGSVSEVPRETRTWRGAVYT